MTIRQDNRLTDAPMVPVECGRCGARVSVRKSTWDQTSVQWNSQASARCLERGDVEMLSPHGTAVFLSCSALRDSILTAVRDGALHIVDEALDVHP